MTVEQFVMAYGAEQDRLRALLPEGFTSLRPVLRINAEVRGGKKEDWEFSTAAEKTAYYEQAAFTVENAAVIPCTQALRAYQVTFER